MVTLGERSRDQRSQIGCLSAGPGKAAADTDGGVPACLIGAHCGHARHDLGHDQRSQFGVDAPQQQDEPGAVEPAEAIICSNLPTE